MTGTITAVYTPAPILVVWLLWRKEMTNQDYYASYLLEKIAELEKDFHRAAAPFYKRLAEIHAHRERVPVNIGRLTLMQDKLGYFGEDEK